MKFSEHLFLSASEKTACELSNVEYLLVSKFCVNAETKAGALKTSKMENFTAIVNG